MLVENNDETKTFPATHGFPVTHLFLPRMTTDRGLTPLNGSILGHNFSVTKSRKVAALTFPS